jgi:hypothetical protein
VTAFIHAYKLFKTLICQEHEVVPGTLLINLLICTVPSVKIWTGSIFIGRKPRIKYDGAIYHAIQRGNNREYIFKQQEDKEVLLKDIIHKQSDLGFKLMGYVI